MKTIKTTTRIIDIVSSIFQNNCISDMENDCKNQITFFDENYSYFKKISNFNDETYKMLNKHFFKDNVLKSEKADREIKKIFFTRFLNREIGRQTFEIFLTELVHILYLYDDVLSFYYDNIEKYIATQKITKNNNSNENIVNNRSIFSTLPQENLNLDVNNDYMQYGDNNTISKTENLQKGVGENVLSDFDYNVIKNIINNNIIEKIFYKIDKKCFLQVW